MPSQFVYFHQTQDSPALLPWWQVEEEQTWWMRLTNADAYTHHTLFLKRVGVENESWKRVWGSDVGIAFKGPRRRRKREEVWTEAMWITFTWLKILKSLEMLADNAAYCCCDRHKTDLPQLERAGWKKVVESTRTRRHRKPVIDFEENQVRFDPYGGRCCSNHRAVYKASRHVYCNYCKKVITQNTL